MKRTLLFLAFVLASITMLAQEYFPEGTKWTEIRLDTLKYDSWYSKVGDEWVPNFETIEYYVKGEYIDKSVGDGDFRFKCVYTNGPEWTDSLTFGIQEGKLIQYYEDDDVIVTVFAPDDYGAISPLGLAVTYQFDWNTGKGICFEDLFMSTTTYAVNYQHYYGIIDEIKEGYFGGNQPLKYVDLDGKAPESDKYGVDTKGGRIIQGIGITEWNDGECLFGPPNPYHALDREYPVRHYRSMLVHFERNGEVLYDVWPEKETTDDSDYLPFVEEGKEWHVVRSEANQGYHFDKYMLPQNATLIDDETGKTYYIMYKSEDDKEESNIVGILREEDRKVYYIESTPQTYIMPKENLLFDYSLKAGDTYETYSYDEEKMVTYKVLSVDDYTEGPQVRLKKYDEKTGNMITHSRYLRKWTVCRTDDNSIQKTWIEGVGSLEGPLANLYEEKPISTSSYLAYVDVEHEVSLEQYLPFSFYDMYYQVHGCNLSAVADHSSSDWDEQFTYELEGDRLHVYGKTDLNCGCAHYAYFFEEPTEDPEVHKLHFQIQKEGTETTCSSFVAVNFYVPGFFPDINYIVVDEYGEEHPVINKMAYRPMIEDDKVWKVGTVLSGNPVQLVQYYYFDGDTIINGKICKQMMCQRYVNPDYAKSNNLSPYNSLNYVGAWYEEDKKVYEYDTTGKQFKLMYDFSLEDNGTFQINDLPYVYVVGPRKTGGIKGFKGINRDVLEWADGESYKCAPWLEGVGVIYGPPTTNIFNVELEDPAWFLMSCTVGEEVIYLREGCEDGATPWEMDAKKHRFDFTHTIKTKPRTRSEEEEQSLYGEYNDQQLGINLDPLDEAYLVRITNESDKVVYEKTINAGNIVGLNIDISAYPEGRYTVTIENNGESFTGEFVTQTTGIEENVKTEIIKNASIYNLQGQRLNTLQRGLNIVNGRKVYVK